MLFLSWADFFQDHLFKKIIARIPSKCHTDFSALLFFACWAIFYDILDFFFLNKYFQKLLSGTLLACQMV